MYLRNRHAIECIPFSLCRAWVIDMTHAKLTLLNYIALHNNERGSVAAKKLPTKLV